MSKVALITNITGQDGSYLAELLLKKGYRVHGIILHSPLPDAEFSCENLQANYPDFHIHHYGWGELQDLGRFLALIRADEIYNLDITSETTAYSPLPGAALSALRMLEAIRSQGLERTTRYYHASSSALCGLVNDLAINEMVTFTLPPSETVARISDFWTAVNYRETFGMYACNGILFNHESPRRSENFVTRKITRGLANITQGLEGCLYLGNLNALRDWGHARDYVKMQWLMLQQDKPEDFVIATGVQFTVRQFVTFAALELGIKLRFVGKGVEEKGVIAAIISPVAAALKVGDVIVAVDPRYMRPAEVGQVPVNPAKARRKLGWLPETSLQDLVIEMVQADLASARQTARLKLYG
ncbi:GDPmannose 4,6-dehydratase [Rahnella sp. BIGb0236]|uniref:GDP-mannose 4,6-dehydratase n=1 Tax=Rahnella sp. BIGb0236 TaxID=2485117 RepID=UPI00105D0CEE|nr:GDP-mannose 4,6-dehydratase [Rahnella sp. BIGb0236]TDS86246.1 GDPmannose 4,6-dehydratase [Rahnella sp. BIGb0236]VTQ53650.1 GDP-D-mannose dehydratase [Campylobacter jejuni]